VEYIQVAQDSVGSCELDNEPWSSIKGEKFLEEMNDSVILKASVPCN
jgi:hypothetical protein